MFRFLAVGGGLVLLLIWAGPWLTKAAKQTVKKQEELYSELDDNNEDDKS